MTGKEQLLVEKVPLYYCTGRRLCEAWDAFLQAGIEPYPTPGQGVKEGQEYFTARDLAHAASVNINYSKMFRFVMTNKPELVEELKAGTLKVMDAYEQSGGKIHA